MKPFKCYVSQITTCKKTYKIVTNEKFDRYYEEGFNFYRRKGKRTNLQCWEVRKYRSWKHNRKTQWKEKRSDI